jgi:CheY-like chemotaxis protein
MKLEYNILWLDDNIDGFIDYEYVIEIENHLIENGFKPNIKTFKKSDDFFELLDSSFDLILTDYHLSEEKDGRQVVDMIRGSKFSVMTEILFYTAKADLGKEQHRIERVSFLETNLGMDAHYRKVTSKTIELIDLTIKKFQNIVAMRGMIMHETSSLDIEFKDILKSILENKPDGLALEKIKKRFKKFNSDSNAEIDEIAELDSLLLKIGASHRWKGLKENIENGNIKDILKIYEDEIITIRNKFAHAVLEEDKSGRKYFKDKRGGVEFNDEKCKTIRENIIKHKQNLENLKKHL